MNLNPGDFNDFLARVGQAALWRRANKCPCRDPYSHAPSPDCRVCINGVVWEEQQAGVMGVAGQRVQRSWEQMGLYQKGDVVCSIPSNTPIYKIGEFDRVLFTDSTVPFSLALKSMPGKIPVVPFQVSEVDRLFWLNADMTELIQGSIPEVDENGAITFGAKAPPAGTQFTITGRKNPEFFCFQDFAQDRAHFGGLELPRRVVLRMFDLFSRAS